MVSEKTVPPVTGKFQMAWESTIDKRVYTDEVVNMVIDAFNMGREQGFQAASYEKKILAEAFSKNLRKAMEKSQQLYNELQVIGKVEPKGLYLKVINKTEFKAAVVLPLDLYYSAERRGVTEKMIETELENNGDDFKLSFMTLPKKESLDLQKLYLDGYIFHYVNHPTKSKA